MTRDSALQPAAARPSVKWLGRIIVLLVIEKIVQHSAVTLAFYFNWSNIRSTVAIDPTILMIAGGIAAVLFVVALYGMLVAKPWARGLIMGLAAFDLVGEFIAQGRIDIIVNVSFLVAAILFLLSLR